MKKVGRNDPCPCGSGKKFKKCCGSKMIGKKFVASKIDTKDLAQKSKGVSSFFQKNIIPQSIPPAETKQETTEKPKKEENTQSEEQDPKPKNE